MCTTITLWNIVSEAQQVFIKTIVPLHCHFNADTIFFALNGEVENLVDCGFVGIEVFDKGFKTAFVFE